MPLPGAKPSRKSQAGRILSVLRDGQWHSATEIFYSLPAGATIHSRISELRKTWGFTILHETRGTGANGSYYKLVGGPDVAGAAHGRPVLEPDGLASVEGRPSASSTGLIRGGDGGTSSPHNEAADQLPPLVSPDQMSLGAV